MVDERDYVVTKAVLKSFAEYKIWKYTWKSTLVFGMLILYSILFMIDFGLTMQHPELEGNPVCVFFIHHTGLPLNLIIPLMVANTYFLIRRFQCIDKNFKLFIVWYIYLLIFIVGHIGGIVSWM